MTTKNGCFQRSEVASGPPISGHPIHLCWKRSLQIRGHSTSSQSFSSMNQKNILQLTQRIVDEKTINLSVWIKEICTLLVKLHMICSRMQRVNLHSRPFIIQVGCTTCCFQVCALDHAKGLLQTWITSQSPAIVMCAMYGKPKLPHVNEARYGTFQLKYASRNDREPLQKRKGINASMLPPCQSTMYDEVRYTNVVATIWNRHI